MWRRRGRIGPARHIATSDAPAKAPAKRPAPRGAPRRRVEDVSGLSKAELLARAAELGIPGRSKMSRDELEHAVAGASKPAKRRKAS